MDYSNFIKDAAHVVPSARQLAWYDMEFYAFVHIGHNTYTNLELGDGKEPIDLFNPTELDCDQWVEAVKSAGMKGIVLTAKHHEGFCLWPTSTTDFSVKSTKWRDGKGDVVKECADACRRGGIKFGVYLSPWDLHAECYGSDAYNDYYSQQLTELLTGYGELFMVWFDGCCGEDPSSRRAKQVYDFDRYIRLIRQYQPNAVIFSDHGPDVRWCGNEAGSARRAEWAVVPSDLCYFSEQQTGAGPMKGDLSDLRCEDECIGDLNVIQYAKGLAFCGAEIDMSIRPGWFYHENEEPHSLERLFHTYMNSCGANTSWNLNVPPMQNGKFHEKDVQRLKELGAALEEAFGEGKIIPYTIEQLPCDSDTQCKFKITLSEPTDLKYIRLREDLTQGQRIEKFQIRFSECYNNYQGYTVGHNLICPVKCTTESFILHVTSARDTVMFRDITLYKA